MDLSGKNLLHPFISGNDYLFQMPDQNKNIIHTMRRKQVLLMKKWS